MLEKYRQQFIQEFNADLDKNYYQVKAKKIKEAQRNVRLCQLHEEG
ncbi:hypothetical protein [Lactococcus allomyrinae]|nr:hypothetical protein [Lactococcus allomyrinae]